MGHEIVGTVVASGPEVEGFSAKGGTVVCAGIHMSPIPEFAYDLLWGERAVRSVANLTRLDGEEFLRVAHEVPLHVEVETLPLAEANHGLERFGAGLVRGAAVLIPGSGEDG